MSTRRDHGEDTAIARVETLLHEAADFTPVESAPEGLATRALARWESGGRDCSPRMRRNFAPAIHIALAGAMLLWLMISPGNDHLPALSESVAKDEVPTPVISIRNTPSFGAQQIASPWANVKVYPASASNPLRLARHASHHQRARAKRPPKAIWTVETVQTEQVGVLYSVLTMPDDASAQASDDSHEVVLQPAVISVPLRSQVTTCQGPSADSFLMPPPMPVIYMPQETDPKPSDSPTSDHPEEKTQP